MIPSLDRLRLEDDYDDEYDTQGPVHTIKKDYNKMRSCQTRKILALFPIQETVKIEQAINVFALPRLLKDTADTSQWIFSSSTSVISAMRVDINIKEPLRTEGTDIKIGSSSRYMSRVIQALDERFANRPSEHSNRSFGPGRCGTFNCVEPNFSLKGDVGLLDILKLEGHLQGFSLEKHRKVQQYLRELITSLHDNVNPNFVMPTSVAVRAPMKSALQYKNEAFTQEESDELALTLYAANYGITPPVLAAFPVGVRSEGSIRHADEDVYFEDGKFKFQHVVFNSFAYVTESGWTDLERTLNNLRTTHVSDYYEAVDSISNNTIALFHSVAESGMLLTDVKLANMVARLNNDTTEYEVKMIDFGAQFTCYVNKFANEQSKMTSPSCVFFVNGLLLANQVLKTNQRHKHVFKNLVREIADTWKEMTINGEGNAFCAILNLDETFNGGRKLPEFLGNMQILREAEFYEMMKVTFYFMLKEYGNTDLLRIGEKKKRHDVNYISRVVKQFKEHYGVS